MKVFITHTFKGSDNKAEIEELCKIIRESGAQDYSFVRDNEKYSKEAYPNVKSLMKNAKKAINECDALLIDITDPSLGKGIEAGIAYQSGKKIIVLLKNGAEVRRTAFGIADVVIRYDQIQDILLPLTNFVSQINNG